MKIYTYDGQSRITPWYLKVQSKWYKRLIIWLIKPELTCILCRRDIMKVLKEKHKAMHIQEKYVFCGECGEKYNLTKI